MSQENRGGRRRVAGIILLIGLVSLVGCIALFGLSVSADVRAWAAGGAFVSGYVSFFALLRWLN